MSRPGLYEQTDTCVLWDIEDCQIPNGLDPYKIQQNIKSALANNGYHGNVTIKAYSEKHQIAEEFESAGIGLVPDGDKYDRIRSMKQEIFCFAYDRIGKPSNLMVISRDKNEFVKSLNSYKKRGFNILLASTQNIERQCCNCAMPPMKKLIDPSTEWLWRSLAFGGDPIAEDKDEEACNSSLSK